MDAQRVVEHNDAIEKLQVLLSSKDGHLHDVIGQYEEKLESQTEATRVREAELLAQVSNDCVVICMHSYSVIIGAFWNKQTFDQRYLVPI